MPIELPTEEMDMAIIEVDDLTKRFKDIVAVDG